MSQETAKQLKDEETEMRLDSYFGECDSGDDGPAVFVDPATGDPHYFWFGPSEAEFKQQKQRACGDVRKGAAGGGAGSTGVDGMGTVMCT